MKKKTEHQEGVRQALEKYQYALDNNYIISSPYDPQKGKIIDFDKNPKTVKPIEITYSDILKASGASVPVEVNPDYAIRGRIGHRLLVNEINSELFCPSKESDEEKAERLAKNQELIDLENRPNTQWMFSENYPTAISTGKIIVNIIKLFLGLKRKTPTFEKTVLIPAGEYMGKQVLLITRGDSINLGDENELAVDNWKFSSKQNFSDSRIQMDMAIQEITAAAIIHKTEQDVDRVFWRNNIKITEKAFLSKEPVDQLPFRNNPPGRIICSDGIVGDEIRYVDNGISARNLLMENIKIALKKKSK